MTNKPMPELLPLPDAFASKWIAGKLVLLYTTEDVSAACLAYGAECVRAMSEQEPVAYCRSDTVLNWKGHLINMAMMFPSPFGLKDPIPLYAAPLPAPEPSSQHVMSDDAGRADGIKSAADWVEKRRLDFEREHGSIDTETGALEFGTGGHAQLKEEYVGELAEIEEGIRALLSRQPVASEQVAKVPDGFDKLAARELAKSFKDNPREASIAELEIMRKYAAATSQQNEQGKGGGV